MFASRAVLILSLCIFAGAQTYQQVWSDEFTGNSLDTSKWQYEVNCDGGGNNELQCYTSNANNLAVSNGVLSITAVPQYLNGKQYTSARINTRASAAWKYGKIEFRAKVPSGQYLWPALWMMPRDNVYGAWAASGEIDIMENRGNTNQQESTLHYGGGWPNNVYQGSGPTYMPFNMTSDFHLYAAIWTPTKIDFLVDNNVYYTQTLQKSFWSGQGSNPYTANGQPFDQYFYIIINLAVGGGFFGGNSQALTVQQAQAWTNPTLSVDYVRVYQLSSSPVNVNPAPAPQSNPTTSSAASTSAAAASTSYTPVATGGGCPAGTCGSNGCCNDQRNGIQCYDVSIYSCPVDGFTSKYGLCQKGYAICSGACYNPAAYQCNNGALGPVSATPKTSAAATPSTTRAATSTTQQTTSAAQAQTTRASTSQAATPATNSACPNGCGTTGQCCNDARSGGLCYLASAHTCVQDTNGKFYLCGPNAGVCGGNCFDALNYKCVNGILGQL